LKHCFHHRLGRCASTTASLICSALNAVRWERDSMDIVAGV
jgi:hypothetical protein